MRRLPSSPERAAALVRSTKTSRPFRLELELGPAPDRGILGVDLEEADEDEGTVRPKSSDAELLSATDAWVTQLAARDAFSGVVLIAREGMPLLSRAWGLADRGLSVPNRADTKFNVGSIGKAFTRAAVMDLVRSRRLRLEDTVASILPSVKVPSSDRITIGDLLEMRSGMGDFFGPLYDATAKSRLRRLSDFLPLFENQPLRFAPGKGRAYSNAGFVVLGLVIEKISGKPYWDFVSERVFEPAGMMDTGPWGPDELVVNRATGYTRREDESWRTNVYAMPGRASSAGGVFSTAGDLLRFLQALSSGRIFLSPPGAPPRESGDFAIAGGTAGANAVVETAPGGLCVIVLANLDPPAAERVASRVRRWFPQKTPVPTPPRTP